MHDAEITFPRPPELREGYMERLPKLISLGFDSMTPVDVTKAQLMLEASRMMILEGRYNLAVQNDEAIHETVRIPGRLEHLILAMEDRSHLINAFVDTVEPEHREEWDDARRQLKIAHDGIPTPNFMQVPEIQSLIDDSVPKHDPLRNRIIQGYSTGAVFYGVLLSDAYRQLTERGVDEAGLQDATFQVLESSGFLGTLLKLSSVISLKKVEGIVKDNSLPKTHLNCDIASTSGSELMPSRTPIVVDREDGQWGAQLDVEAVSNYWDSREIDLAMHGVHFGCPARKSVVELGLEAAISMMCDRFNLAHRMLNSIDGYQDFMAKARSGDYRFVLSS